MSRCPCVVVTFGSGGLMATVTLIAETQAQLDATDLPPTVKVAAARYVAMISPG